MEDANGLLQYGVEDNCSVQLYITVSCAAQEGRA